MLYLPDNSNWTEIEKQNRASEDKPVNTVTVYIKNGRILVVFTNGMPYNEISGIACEIKSYPDVAKTQIQRGDTILVTMASVRNVAERVTQFAEIARTYTPPPPPKPYAVQASMF